MFDMEIDPVKVYGGAILAFLLSFNATVVSLLALIGGGLIAGFVVGYTSGDIVRGAWQAMLAGLIGGFAYGMYAAVGGVLLIGGIEPTTILGRIIGYIGPIFDGALLPVAVGITFVYTVDAILAGIVGGAIGKVVRP